MSNQFFILLLIFLCPLFLILSCLTLHLLNFKQKTLYVFSLFGTALNFLLTLYLMFLWTNSPSYIYDYDSILISLHPSIQFEFLLGIDSISLLFLLLTNLFIYLCILHLYESLTKSLEMLIYLFILQWGVLGSFMIFDILGFFIFFETTLIPIFLMILVYGSRERKIRASYLIAIYTLFGSIFMFFNILYLFSKFGTTNYFHLLNLNFSELDARFLWLTFFIAFAAKVPMLPLHIWLPEAHVEAPTVGSVLLAALLLKLGTYGIIRFLVKLFPEATQYHSTLINLFAIVSVLYTSLTAIRQIDLKKIIAYSSVGHMNVVLLGLLILSIENFEGSIFQMLSHGIVSGALFFCVGAFYIRFKVRSLDYFGGFMLTHPLLSVFFMIFSMANISFPGTSNFVGEFMIMFGLFSQNSVMAILSSINMITGAAYTLWAYNRVAFGNLKDMYILKHFDLIRSEFYLFFLLTFIMFIMGIFPSFFLNIMHEDVAYIVINS